MTYVSIRHIFTLITIKMMSLLKLIILHTVNVCYKIKDDKWKLLFFIISDQVYKHYDCKSEVFYLQKNY